MKNIGGMNHANTWVCINWKAVTSPVGRSSPRWSVGTTVVSPSLAGRVGGEAKSIILILLYNLLGSWAIDLSKYDIVKHCTRLGNVEVSCKEKRWQFIPPKVSC